MKIAILAASLIVVVVVAGVVLVITNQGGKPAVHYGEGGDWGDQGYNVPTEVPSDTSIPTYTPEEWDRNTPMECVMIVPSEPCVTTTTLRIVPPYKYYKEDECGGVTMITETANGIDYYSYNSLMGWYHTVVENPEEIDTGYEEFTDMLNLFEQKDLIPEGVSITCKPLGSVPEEWFQPPADAEITDMGGN